MRKDFETLFSVLVPPKPPANLFSKIMQRIDAQYQIATLKRKIAFWAILFISSLGTFIPALRILKTEINESGFGQFVSLIFSDSKEILLNWQNFALALLESLPTISIVLILTLTIICLQFLRNFTHNLKTIYGLQ